MRDLHSEEPARPAADWWRTPTSLNSARIVLGKCVLGMILSAWEGDQEKVYIHSGFLITYYGILLWVTAGHVIDLLVHIRTSKAIINSMRWFDRYPVKGAEATPIHNRDLQMIRIDNIDVGYVLVDKYDAWVMSHNPNVNIVVKDSWSNLDFSMYDGYYLLGYPDSGTTILSTRKKKQGKAIGTVKAPLVCLPLRRIAHRPDQQHIDFWRDPDAFYAQILPSDESNKLSGVGGMSGSPVFSVRRVDDAIEHKLVGIQSKQLSGEPVVCIEPIERAVNSLDNLSPPLPRIYS